MILPGFGLFFRRLRASSLVALVLLCWTSSPARRSVLASTCWLFLFLLARLVLPTVAALIPCVVAWLFLDTSAPWFSPSTASSGTVVHSSISSVWLCLLLMCPSFGFRGIWLEICCGNGVSFEFHFPLHFPRDFLGSGLGALSLVNAHGVREKLSGAVRALHLVV